jgi:hypothetical protein
VKSDDRLLTLIGLRGRQRSQGQRKVISLLSLPLREVGQLGFVPLQRTRALIIDSRQKIQERGGQNVATYLSNTCQWCSKRSERTLRDEIVFSLSLNKSLVSEAFKNFKETQSSFRSWKSINIFYLYYYVRRDHLCGLVVRVPGYRNDMYCVSCEVRTEFIYVM